MGACGAELEASDFPPFYRPMVAPFDMDLSQGSYMRAS